MPDEQQIDRPNETPEYDFGPFKKEVVRIWNVLIDTKNVRADSESQKRIRPKVEALKNELVELAARCLIDSKGAVVEPYNILDSSQSKGVFRALHEAFSEASGRNRSYLMPAQWEELNYTQNIAAKAVQIILAEKSLQASAKPSNEATSLVAEVGEAANEVVEGGEPNI